MTNQTKNNGTPPPPPPPPPTFGVPSYGDGQRVLHGVGVVHKIMHADSPIFWPRPHGQKKFNLAEGQILLPHIR